MDASPEDTAREADGVPGPDPNITAMRGLCDLLMADSATSALYEGGCKGRWIYSEPPVEGDGLRPGASVQAFEMAKGSELGVHAHERETEILVVFGGILYVTVDGGSPIVLAPGMSLALRPGQVHSVQAVEFCTGLGITVPADRGYPRGPGIKSGPVGG
jgi:quercetin dioxygenase-like cupin family protein